MSTQSGWLIAAAGLLWLAQLPTHSAYVVPVLLPTLILGAGMSVMMMPAVVAATTGVEARNSGAASGPINMSRQIGALGLSALVVTIAATVTHHSHSGGAAPVVDGYHTALLLLAAISLTAAALSLCLQMAGAQRRPRPGSVSDAQPAVESSRR